MLVSCLLTLATSWCSRAALVAAVPPPPPSPLTVPAAPASPPQIPLAAHHHTPAPSPNNASSSVISPALFADLEELARIVDISYCVGAVGIGIQKPFACPSRCADFPNFELVTTWNTGPLLSDSCGFVALSHDPAPKRIILAFRGTYSLSNTLADLSTIPQEYAPYPGVEDPSHEDAPKCLNCTVHTGFYTSWANTRDVVLPHVLAAREKYPDYALTLVGHSLGGAVAAFAGLELLARGLNPTVTTFGEPRIGNAAMSSYLDARFALLPNAMHNHTLPYRRVTHANDPIPLLPLSEWGYVPHSGEIYISTPDLPPNATQIRHCTGPADVSCIAGAEEEGKGGFWAVPARFRLWQLFFAHRDYFWRLGLCVPGLEGWWPWVGEGGGETETDL